MCFRTVLTSHKGYQLPDEPLAQATGLLEVPQVQLGTRPFHQTLWAAGNPSPKANVYTWKKILVSSEEKPQASHRDFLCVLYTNSHWCFKYHHDSKRSNGSRFWLEKWGRERAWQGQSYFCKGPQAAIWGTQQGSYMWSFCIVQINKYRGGVRAPGMWSFSVFTLLFSLGYAQYKWKILPYCNVSIAKYRLSPFKCHPLLHLFGWSPCAGKVARKSETKATESQDLLFGSWNKRGRFIYIFSSVYVCACICIFRGKKRVLKPLKLELKVALSCPAGAGNWSSAPW